MISARVLRELPLSQRSIPEIHYSISSSLDHPICRLRENRLPEVNHFPTLQSFHGVMIRKALPVDAPTSGSLQKNIFGRAALRYISNGETRVELVERILSASLLRSVQCGGNFCSMNILQPKHFRESSR